MDTNYDDIGCLSKKGYLLKKNFIGQEDIDKIINVIEAYCNFYKADYFHKDRWLDASFQEKLIALRKTERHTTSKIYDALQANALLQGIVSQNYIVEYIAHLMNISKNCLTLTGAMVRMDFPFDEKNRLNWHIEQSYYTYNGRGTEGLVLWIPLVDVDLNNGTIMIKEKSHEMDIDYVDIERVIKSGTPGISEQYRIPDNILEEYNTINIELNSGDAAIFYMNTLHASGYNKSDFVRIAIGARYHNSFSEKYNVVKLVPTPTS